MKLNPNLNKAFHLHYSDTCQYCHISCKGKGHIDHIVPISKGGKDKLSNYILACIHCNSHKAGNLLSKQRIKKYVLVAYKNKKSIQTLYNSQRTIPIKCFTLKHLNPELWRQVKMLAAKKGITIKKLILVLLKRETEDQLLKEV